MKILFENWIYCLMVAGGVFLIYMGLQGIDPPTRAYRRGGFLFNSPLGSIFLIPMGGYLTYYGVKDLIDGFKLDK